MLQRPQQDSHAHTGDDAPFELLPGSLKMGLILICDHASNALPAEYGTLGLGEEQFNRHIAYDIGVAPITRRLSEALGVPAFLHNYSRLLIDPNRGLDDPTLVMRLSDGAIVPGNADIDDKEIAIRIDRYHSPYHRAIGALIDEVCETGRPPMLLSLHSFTEAWKGAPRPWHAGILWDRDDRLVKPLMRALQGDPHLVVGYNVPYSGELEGDCMNRHGTKRGLAHALIELRQDLIRSETGQQEWAERLTDIVGGVLEDEALIDELRSVLPDCRETAKFDTEI